MAEFSIKQSLDAALQHHRAGRLSDAETLYRDILARQPDHADALHLLGVLALQRHRADIAVELIRRAIERQPDNPLYLSNLGNALRQQGKLDEAIASYRRALALQPQYAQTQTLLGVALKDKGLLDEAVTCYRRALDLQPDDADTHNNLGSVRYQQGMPEAAIACYRRALELNPNYAEAHYNFGIALRSRGHLDEAVACYQRALVLRPDLADAHYNLGNVLQELERRDEAIVCYRQAIALRPGFAEAHYNLALELLLRGSYTEAWPHYEWRWNCKDFHSPARDFAQPLWDGGNLAGRTIHLHAEQGLGDSLHFIRYVPLVAQCGGIIHVECQPQLKRLFQNLACVAHVFTTGDLLPGFDIHCPLQTLPLLFGTTPRNIPRKVPYLLAPVEEINRWSARFHESPGRTKVGLVWAGNSLNINDRNRSISLSMLASLATVADVAFYSLQKGEPAKQAVSPPSGMNLIDWSEDLDDFADTAALIANLDLVISVDTAVAHLAGAMGKKVWMLLPAAPDWRWMLARDDSPWYPTLRLFRQTGKGRWDDVVQRMMAALSALASRPPTADIHII